MFTADMRTGQRQIVAQKIGEVLSTVDFSLNNFAVYASADSLGSHDQFPFRAWFDASLRARRVKTCASERR
jgi:hypothetical protein